MLPLNKALKTREKPQLRSIPPRLRQVLIISAEFVNSTSFRVNLNPRLSAYQEAIDVTGMCWPRVVII